MALHPFNDKQLGILDVAEKLFAEKGFDGTSVRDIAKTANINVAMISYYFGSKEKLLEGIVLYRSANLKLQMESITNQTVSPMEKLENLIEFFVHLVHKNKCIYQIINTEFNSQKREIDLELFNSTKKNNYLILERVIKEGQEAGVFKKNINIPMLVPTILGTYFYFSNNHVFYSELIGLKNELEIENYIHNDLLLHIKQVIKSLVTHETV